MKRPTPRRNASKRQRRGAAAVELAVLLPFLLFLALISMDYGRIVFHVAAVTNAARNAAMYQADSDLAATLPYQSAQQAANAETADLPTPPTVTTATGTDAAGNRYVEATVSHVFRTVVNYPGIPSSVTITRTVRMPLPPS